MGRRSWIALSVAVLLSSAARESVAQYQDPEATRTRSPKAETIGLEVAGAGALFTVLSEAVIFNGLSQYGFSGLGEAAMGVGLLPFGGSLLLSGIPVAMVGATDRHAESPGLVAVGITSTTLGAGVFVAGMTTLAFAEHSGSSSCFNGACTYTPSPNVPIGAALLVGGTAMAGVGFGLWLIGDRRKKADGVDGSWVARPDLHISPGLGSLRWTF